MSATSERLDSLAKSQKKFLKKGGLCVGLVVTQIARDQGSPLDSDQLRTEEDGQVAGLGKAAVQKILEKHGITKVLAEEGGRTSRGSLGLMKAYVRTLNELYAEKLLNLDEALAWWIEKVRLYFASEGPKFSFDTGKSLRANIQDLFEQAKEMQEGSGGTNYVGAMLQHLVGAKLDVVLGKGKVVHFGFSVADHSTGRQADYEIDGVTIHATTHPTEALIRKCEENIKSGLKPLIITLGEGVGGAEFLLKNLHLEERVDVLDIEQFLTANVYERSFFKTSDYKMTLLTLIERYNAIVGEKETDPAFLIRVAKPKSKK
jgi:hypothetical protein